MRRFSITNNPNTFPRSVQGICPFPGKHPLRMVGVLWVTNENGESVPCWKYYGKLTNSAWKVFTRLFRKALTEIGRPSVVGQWYIFDKNNVIASGNSPSFAGARVSVNEHSWLRYFWRSRFESDPLGKLIPTRVGKYWVYAADPIALEQAEIRAREFLIDRHVPHIRGA